MSGHPHRWQPYDVRARMVRLSCLVCGKRQSKATHHCEPCDVRAREHQAALQRRAGEYMAALKNGRSFAEADEIAGPMPPDYAPGCSDCFRGWIVPQWQAPCCCYREGERCLGCETVGKKRDLPHVCDVATEAELDHEFNLALMKAPETRVPSKEAHERAMAMDQSQGIRVKKYD